MSEERLIGLGGLPGGFGPAATTIAAQQVQEPSSTPVLVDGQLVIREDLGFRLFRAGAPSVDDSSVAGLPDELPAAALAELGSVALAEALRGRDFPGALEALAEDHVVVAVRRDGEIAEALGLVAGEGIDVPVFSSAATLEAFLTEVEPASFVLRPGVAVIEFVVDGADRFGNLVLDPGSAHSMVIRVSDLVAILGVPAEAEAPEPEDPRPEQIVGFSVPLDDNWGALNLSDPESRAAQIRALVKQQTRSLSDQGAALRHDMRTWLARSADQAASAGGKQFAFLLAHTDEAAAALTMVTYWHDLGSGADGPSLDRLGDHLLNTAQAADELVKLGFDGDAVIRHTRVRHGDAELGGKDVMLLMIDYWLAVPGSAGSLAHVSFSTPHVPAREAMLALADTLVLSGRWLGAEEVAA